jgi:hypothetical protein
VVITVSAPASRYLITSSAVSTLVVAATEPRTRPASTPTRISFAGAVIASLPRPDSVVHSFSPPNQRLRPFVTYFALLSTWPAARCIDLNQRGADLVAAQSFKQSERWPAD